MAPHIRSIFGVDIVVPTLCSLGSGPRHKNPRCHGCLRIQSSPCVDTQQPSTMGVAEPTALGTLSFGDVRSIARRASAGLQPRPPHIAGHPGRRPSSMVVGDDPATTVPNHPRSTPPVWPVQIHIWRWPTAGPFGRKDSTEQVYYHNRACIVHNYPKIR